MVGTKSASVALSVAGMLTLASAAQASMDRNLQCRLGAYVLSDGRSLAINGYDGTPRDMRYTLSSGEYGRLSAAGASGNTYVLGDAPGYGSASFSDCADGKVSFAEKGRPAVTGTHLPLNVTDTFFESGGTRLHGKLVLPANGKAKAIVVWIQGSDDDPETDDIYWQYILPLHGVGVFAYDKRGSGNSQGELSADFYVRATDTAAAVGEVRRLQPGVQRIGVFGGSQGGWVAPLTATKTNLAFVIVGYGLAEGVTVQDRDEVDEAVRAAGYGDDELKKVDQITDATTRIVKSGWKSGWSEFAALRQKYANEPWIKAINAENGYTGILLQTPIAKAQVMGPQMDKHVSFGYDPEPVIASIAPPQLWLLGGLDHTAPNTNTIEILKNIQRKKRDLNLIIYKDDDHGLAESFLFEGVNRHRNPGNLSDVVAQWILTGTLPNPADRLEVWPNMRGASAPGASP